MIAAVFDLDGTLYTGHIGSGIARHHRHHRVGRLQFLLYMAAHLPLYAIRRIGLMSESVERAAWARDMGWTVRGWTEEQGQHAFRWIASNYVMPLVRQDVLARLREHQAAGHRVLLVSGTLSPLLEVIADQLGVDETVGTPMVVAEGRYTGRTVAPPCQGEGKLERLRIHLDRSGGIDWGSSTAYADSHTDIPLMEAFGKPVAVHPEPKLQAHAERKGWGIVA